MSAMIIFRGRTIFMEGGQMVSDGDKCLVTTTVEVLTWYGICIITMASSIACSSCGRQKSSPEAAKCTNISTGTCCIGPRGLGSSHVCVGRLTSTVMATHHVTVLCSCRLRISPLQQTSPIVAFFTRSIRRTNIANSLIRGSPEAGLHITL